MTSERNEVIDLDTHASLISGETWGDLSTELSRRLGEWNVRHTSSVGDNHGAFGSAQLTRLVLMLCRRLKQPNSVLFRTLDIFERFMECHMLDLRDHVVRTASVERRCDAWSQLMTRISAQVMLRLMSCMQIASKMTLHYKIITTKKTKMILSQANHCYSLESIVNSELRVLKTLQFKVSDPTELDFVELFVTCPACCHDNASAAVSASPWQPTPLPSNNNVGNQHACVWRQLLATATRLLCCVRVNRNRVYARLLSNFGGAGICGAPAADSARRGILNSVCADREALAASVVAAAAALQLSHAQADVLTAQLATASRVDVHDLLDFSEAVLRDTLQLHAATQE